MWASICIKRIRCIAADGVNEIPAQTLLHAAALLIVPAVHPEQRRIGAFAVNVHRQNGQCLGADSNGSHILGRISGTIRRICSDKHGVLPPVFVICSKWVRSTKKVHFRSLLESEPAYIAGR